MTSQTMTKRTIYAWVAAAVAALVVTIAWMLLLDRESDRLRRAANATAVDYLSTKRAEIEQLLNRRLFVVRGLEALVRLNPRVTKEHFDILAKNFFEGQPGIRALQLAPKGRIVFVYPVQGNEESVNKDLLADPARGPAARRAIATRKFFLAGPFELYQGGLGLVGRVPIFFGDEFWGFSQVVLNYETLLQDVGLRDTTSPFEYAMRGKDELGEYGEVIFGRPGIFSESPVLASIALPTGSWQIAAVPREGWDSVSKLPSLMWVFGLLITLSSGVLMRMAVGRWLRLKWELKESQDVWQFALEGSGDGVWDCDVQTGTAHFSKRWKEMLGYAEGDITSHLDEWSSRVHPDDQIRVFAEVDHALSHPSGTYHCEHRVRQKDGTYLWVLARGKVFGRLSDGSPVRLIGTQIDISERKRAEEALWTKDRAIETSIDAIAMADLTGRLTYVNPAFLNLWRISSREEVLGRPVEAFWGVPERAAEMLQATIEGKGWIGELLARREDGTKFDVEIAASLVADQAGRPICLMAAIVDITSRKAAEEALRLSEELFRTSFENAMVGVGLVGIDGRFISVNTMLCAIFGYKSEELVQTTFQAITHPEDASVEEPLIQDILLGRATSAVFEKRYIRKDGKIVWAHVSTALVRRRSGVPQNYITFVQDITERKHAEELLRLNDERLRNAQAMAHVGNWEINLQTWMIWGSEEAFRIYGLPHGVTSERSFVEVQQCVLPGHRPALDEALKRLLSSKGEYGEGDYDVEFQIRRTNDGEIRHVHSKGQLVTGPNGAPARIVGVIQDITDRKLAEQRVQESEERYRLLVEFSPEAIAVHRDGRFLYVNPSAVALMKAKDVQDLLSMPVIDMIHPDYRKVVRERIETGMADGKPLPIQEEKFIRRDGEVIDVEVASLCIQYGGRPAMQVVARDITEQKKLQQQLLQTQKIQSIGTLAAGIAHDFNNILSIILGYVSLLEHGADDPMKRSERLNAITSTIDRGAALVRQILVFARQASTTFAPVQVTELIRELLSMLRQTFPRIVTFAERYAPDLPRVNGDRTQIHQAILNLCVNARDAMPEGGNITVSVEAINAIALRSRFPSASAAKYLLISIADTGIGMDETTRTRVFDPFFTTKEKGKGTGLGLSVVYGVVQSHHGFIDVETSPGEGAAFHIYLPAMEASAGEAEESVPADATVAGGTETILVAEDEELLASMLEALLESRGYTVRLARDGQEAVDIFAAEHDSIDLVITDMGLPKLLGKDVFRRLKEIEPRVRILLASGFVEPEVRADLMRSGALGFLEKPYATGSLLRAIREALDRP